MSRRGWWIGVAIVVGIWALTRAWAFASFGETVYARRLLLDPLAYFTMAQDFAAGNARTDQAYYLGPGWPFLLGVIFKITGTSITAGRALNVVLSFCTLVSLLTAGKLLRGPVLGIACGALWAVYMPAIFTEQTLLMETAACTLTAALALLCVGSLKNDNLLRRPWMAIALGVLLGIAALFRANILALAPLLCIAIFCATWMSDMSRLGAAFKAIALFVAGLALAIAPATIHNFRAERVFIPITSNLGINLWVGIGPAASGGYVPPPSTIGNNDGRGLALAQRVLGNKEINSKELSHFWTQQALKDNSASRIARLTLVKLGLFFQNRDTPQIYDQDVMAEDISILRAPLPGQFFITFPLLLALFILLHGGLVNRTLAVGALLLIASLLPFFITGRYRLPLAPWLMLTSGAGLFDLWRMRARFMERRVVSAIMLLALLFAPFALKPFLRDANATDTRSPFLQMKAALLTQDGNYNAALVAIREVNAKSPTAPSLSTQAKLYEIATKDFAGAVRLYEQALTMEQLSGELWFNAAQAEMRVGALDKAREDYEKAVSLDEGMPVEAWFNLGALRYMAGDREGAERIATQLDRQQPQEGAALRAAFAKIDAEKNPKP
ncbi:hypothetical protein BH09SUM1_BH09SUM1_20270 [soil metagenome]